MKPLEKEISSYVVDYYYLMWCENEETEEFFEKFAPPRAWESQLRTLQRGYEKH
jgi:hypothetical protein